MTEKDLNKEIEKLRNSNDRLLSLNIDLEHALNDLKISYQVQLDKVRDLQNINDDIIQINTLLKDINDNYRDMLQNYRKYIYILESGVKIK